MQPVQALKKFWQKISSSQRIVLGLLVSLLILGPLSVVLTPKTPQIAELTPIPATPPVEGFGNAIVSTKRSQAALYTQPIIPLKKFTFEAWIKPSPFTDNWTEGYLFSQKQTEEVATPQVSLALAGNSQFNKGKGELRVRFYDPQPHELTSGYVVDTNQWHHIAWVKDDTSVRLYVDGAKKAAAGVNEFYLPNPINLIIGNYNLNQTYRQYYGSLDEVRISDTARYFGDMVLLKMEPFVPDGNTVALYDFNDDITDTLGRFNLNIIGSVDFVQSTIIPPSPTPSPSPKAMLWETPQVTLKADDFYILADGKKYYSTGTDLKVTSDPGNNTYTTLEGIWHENGVEMRMFLYFYADSKQWGVSEIRTYNGQSPYGDWIYYRQKMPLGSFGQPYTASTFDLYSDTNNQYKGEIHFKNLYLLAFKPLPTARPSTNPSPLVSPLPSPSPSPEVCPATCFNFVRRKICLQLPCRVK